MEHALQGSLAPAMPAENERHWAAMAHLGALLLAALTSWTAGIAGVLAAGIVYLAKRGESAFVAGHAREALNFNLSMFLYACAAGMVGTLLVGATVFTLGLGAILTIPAGIVLLLAVAAIAVSWLACSVLAAVKAWQGEDYRYPLSLRLFR